MKKKFTLIAAIAVAIQMNAQAPTWTSQNANLPTNSMFPQVMSVANDNTVWSFVADGSGQKQVYSVFTKTSDGGANWTSGNIGIGSGVALSDIAAGDANTAWVAAYPTSGKGGIWKTTNGGTSWTKQTSATFSNSASFPNVVYFWDLNNGVAMGDPIANNKLEVYTTTNGGTTWTAVTGGDAQAGEGGYTSIKAVAGNTIWCGSNFGRIYRSNDKGNTWLPTVSTPLSDFGSTKESGVIALKDANTGWVCSSLGMVFKTENAGQTFDEVDHQSGILYTAAFIYVPGTDQTLVSGGGSTNGRGSSISFDGGANWTEIVNSNADVGITALGAKSANAIYGGNFYSTTNGGGMNKLTGALATSEATSQKALAISPNPTYGDLNISTVLNVKSVEIVDMNGRLVKTFGADSKKLDLSALQAGVYAVKVNTTDGKSQITKFIKK